MEIDEAAEEILAGVGARTAEILPLRQPDSRGARSGYGRGAPVRKAAWGRGAIAAAVMGVTVAIGFAGWKASQGSLVTYRTAPGETRSITLADGSHIRLDAASTMSVRLSPFVRRGCDLGDAEAAFDVAKDTRRPFEVAVGDQRVRVLGTEFQHSQLRRAHRRHRATRHRRGLYDRRTASGQTDQGHRVAACNRLQPVHDEARRSVRRLRLDARPTLICDDLPLSDDRPLPQPQIRHAYGGSRRASVSAVFRVCWSSVTKRSVARRLAGYMSLTMHGSASRNFVKLDRMTRRREALRALSRPARRCAMMYMALVSAFAVNPAYAAVSADTVAFNVPAVDSFSRPGAVRCPGAHLTWARRHRRLRQYRPGAYRPTHRRRRPPSAAGG